MTALVLAASLLFLAARSQSDDLAPGELVEGDLAFQLDEYLTRLEGLGFSGIVGVEHEGVPILIRGYGMADREHGLPVTPGTVFCTGSITKQFTATAILALREEKKLDVQDPLSRYFADVPADKRALTLHHLLTHTSGLVDPAVGDYDLVATADWVRAQTFATPLEWQPGAEYGYRNVNFSLLAMVVERVSGKPYETYLQERLFARAGMQQTGYRLPRFAPDSFAIGYTCGEPWGTTLSHAQLADGPCWTLRGNGGIQSTVGDMLRWHHALQEDRVLTAASRALLETPYADEGGGTSYGYGWSIQKSPSGAKLVAHNGGNQVFFADFLRFVDEGHCIFVATNVASRMRSSLAYDLAAILYGRTPRALPETLERDRAMLERYAGRYALANNPDGATLELVNEGDRLGLTGSGAGAEALLLDTRGRERVEEARKFAAEVLASRDDAVPAYHGESAPAEVQRELAATRARWRKELGAFQRVGAGTLRSGRDTRVSVELVFERGSAFLALTIGPAGRLIGCECLDSAPFVGLERVELFPLAPDEFRAYDDRSGLGLRVRFELDDAGRATVLRLGEASAARS
jgi:CubicO group peptidase (beta-lactamase class C family)